MKRDWSKIAAVVSCILLLICLVQISDLKQQVNHMRNDISNRISNVENSVQNISSEVYRQLEKEASLLADSQWEYGDVNMEDHTVMLRCSVCPKEYQPEVTKAVLLCGSEEYLMTLENGAYITDIRIPVFEESKVDQVQFCEAGVVRTEALNWYLSPRYECLTTVYADFSGTGSFSKNENVYVLDMSGDVNLYIESKGGNFHAEKIYLAEYIDEKEISREEIQAEQMSAMDYYYALEKKREVPFGCTYDLYIEVVDNYGLHHRNRLEHKAIDSEGNLVDADLEWWHGAEGSIYDEEGNPLYVINEY